MRSWRLPRVLLQGANRRPFIARSTSSSGLPSAKHPNIGKFSTELKFMNNFGEPFITYRVLDDFGKVIDPANEPKVEKEFAIRMFTTMLRLNVMDSIMYESQRQGRISFYMTSYGEEATVVGSAAALSLDDVVFAQYRESGVLLWRGFTYQEACDQCIGNSRDKAKGRMMPVHYGSKALNFHTVSSPLATQLPHAAGAAYALKRQGKAACSVCYFGDGAASEGDFHAALNFAATLECPVLYFCRNNGYAISTPVSEQYRGDGIAVRGVSYNIHTVRCDGNDVWAVYEATRQARDMAVRLGCPVLVEAMTYRGGHHSTSDDASRYRGKDEVSRWSATNNPIERMRRWLVGRGWWGADDDARVRDAARAELLQALESAETRGPPEPSVLFEDVYDAPPSSLREQAEDLARVPPAAAAAAGH